MKPTITVSIRSELLEAVFEGAKRLHPRETILLLRGKKSKELITVSELVIPPFATYGHGFANVPIHRLPMDLSVVGTVHSHPSGRIDPSTTDLNHFFGAILLIVGFPYENQSNVAAFNRNGDLLPLQVSS